MPALPTETDDRMVYLCPSDLNPKIKYRVDLLANGGAGWCQCTDFSTRRQPALDKGAAPWTKATTCKHLKRTLWFFAVKVVKRLAQQENGK